MDRGTWQAVVPGVAKSRTQLRLNNALPKSQISTSADSTNHTDGTIVVVVLSLSHVQLTATLWTVAYQAPLSI